MPDQPDQPPPEQEPVPETEHQDSDLREQAKVALRQHFHSTADHLAAAKDQTPTGHQKHK